MSNPFSLFKLPPSSQSSSQNSTPATQRRRQQLPTRQDEFDRTEPPSPSISRYHGRTRKDLSPDPSHKIVQNQHGKGGREDETKLAQQSFSPSTPVGKDSHGDRALFSNLRSKLKGPTLANSTTYRDGYQIESPTTATRRSEIDLRNARATGGKRKISDLYDTIRKQRAVTINNSSPNSNEDAVVRSENGSTPSRTGPIENTSTPLSKPRFLFRQTASSPETFPKNPSCSPFSSASISQANSSLEATPQHWLKTVILPKSAEAKSGNDVGSNRAFRDKGQLSDRLSRVLARKRSEEVLWRYRSNNGTDDHQSVSMTVRIKSTVRTRGMVIADCFVLNVGSAPFRHQSTITRQTGQQLKLGFATYSENGSRSDVDDIDVFYHGRGDERKSPVVDTYEPLIKLEGRLDGMCEASSEAEIMLICTRWKVRVHP